MFRARALKRISSPEQLDRLVHVTSPRTWIGLGGLLLVVAVVILWSTISVVPTTLSGPGILLPLGGLREVQASGGGTVSTFPLSVGTHVVADQAIGTITGPEGSSTPVRAPQTGTIMEVDAAQRAVVQAGQRLALVEPAGWPLVMYAYVPTRIANALARGTPVHVGFASGIEDAYGYAKGKVQSVGRFAATNERLNFILRDSSFVDKARSLGPSNEVVVSLDMSAKTRSGLAWGSGSGPPGSLPTGLPANVTFIVGSHHPIDDVL